MRAEPLRDLPPALVVFTGDGRAQFGWFNPTTGEYCAEADGRHIPNVVGAVDWIPASFQ